MVTLHNPWPLISNRQTPIFLYFAMSENFAKSIVYVNSGSRGFFSHAKAITLVQSTIKGANSYAKDLPLANLGKEDKGENPILTQ